MSSEILHPSNRGYNAGKAQRLAPDRVRLYRPGSEWTYSHHPFLTFFNGFYYAVWSNGRRDEDAPGQRVLLSRSPDFLSWSAPVPLFDTQQGLNSELVFTAAGFHLHDKQLIAYASCFEYAAECIEGGARPAGDTGHMNTTMLAKTTRDGLSWSDPRDLRLPVNPNHGPQRTKSGRLIMSANVSYPYTDDPSGLDGWRMTGIYPPEMAHGLADHSASFQKVKAAAGWPVYLCEGSFYQTDDSVLHMLLRTNTERLWITESRDDGATWSSPTPTGFSDNATKFHFGRLPDGRFYYVGCPDPEPLWTRSTLVLSLSRDGQVFDRHFVLADSSTPYAQVASGMHKNGDYGYPHTLVHADSLHVIVSRRKEGVEVLRVPLESLE